MYIFNYILSKVGIPTTELFFTFIILFSIGCCCCFSPSPFSQYHHQSYDNGCCYTHSDRQQWPCHSCYQLDSGLLTAREGRTHCHWAGGESWKGCRGYNGEHSHAGTHKIRSLIWKKKHLLNQPKIIFTFPLFMEHYYDHLIIYYSHYSWTYYDHFNLHNNYTAYTRLCQPSLSLSSCAPTTKGQGYHHPDFLSHQLYNMHKQFH